ncbi:MAG TPA: undecaprenyldiphospho-muramoylpentapeptide beta-N-acetylglucosaminyltransferase [Clostridiaceae bacterium]|nr:undecaprenyldiphospho-muramoylpentapeptide beta-N-acetylglucosaminyltransferase [Clostridiaceae bacterium]
MNVLISGGGTAGHINPGIAIAKFVRSKHPDANILFVGTRRGMEGKLVPAEGFNIKFIKVRGFKRSLSFDNLVVVKELFEGLREAKKIINEFKPDIVIGTGGYVCGPVVYMAWRMKIPTLIHEQNAFPGVTNRILARFVNAVAISFKESEKYFKHPEKLVYTGNPIRQEIIQSKRSSAREKLGLKPGEKLVVIAGGSLGAQKINQVVTSMLLKYGKLIDYNIIFSTGNSQYETVKKSLEGFSKPSIKIVPYIYDAADVYAAADIMVCRSGAITCSEVTVLGLPAIMIPSPNVVANHQEYNARSLEKQGAAVVILEKDFNEEVLYSQIDKLLMDETKLHKMSANSKKIGIQNASEKIYEVIEKLISNE